MRVQFLLSVLSLYAIAALFRMSEDAKIAAVIVLFSFRVFVMLLPKLALVHKFPAQ